MTTGKRIRHPRGTTRTASSGRVASSAVGLVTATGVACGIAGGAGAGPAVAAPASRTLNYTCSFQSITQHATVTMDADVPGSAVVGKPTRRFTIHAGAPVSAAATSGLKWFGAKTVEGTVDARARVVAPQGHEDVTVPFTVPRTGIPESGPLHVKATGTAPSRTFSRPGKARITVGDLVLHVVPRDANGKVTAGRSDVPCKLDPGQDNVVATFDIAGATTPDDSATPGGNGTTPSGTARPDTPKGAGATADRTPRSTASGTPGSTTGPDSTDGAQGSTHPGQDGTRADGVQEGGIAHGSTTPSPGATTADSHGAWNPVLPAVGALIAGVLAAAAFRFRSRKRR